MNNIVKDGLKLKKSNQPYTEDGKDVKVMSIADIQKNAKELAFQLSLGNYIKITRYGKEIGMIVPF
ncbi:MAG: hypothetical protein GY804_02855 [Alphaproteobacteria bacterium]|nr:hypothetical protein [Alphaproteobacteria bacterium]